VATYRAVPVTDATAHALLAEYFAYREQTFPSAAGYVTTFPAPAQFEEPDGVFVVVDVDGESVGCGGIRSLGNGPRLNKRFEVKHLWLQPSTQGRGLGRALLAELERRALLLGATELVLDTNASLEAAGGLYRSSGYVDIEPYNDNPNATNWYLKTLQ
jgi:GNAT superfamily N-acetyltransferase